MSSIYFDIVVGNVKAYSVSIRKMNLPQDGFGSVWAYEITPTGSPTPLRGTVSDLPREGVMEVVHGVITDYQEQVGAFAKVNQPYSAPTEQSSHESRPITPE